MINRFIEKLFKYKKHSDLCPERDRKCSIMDTGAPPRKSLFTE
jgi:hypothetical protein